MEILDIPFVKKVGIDKNQDGNLTLSFVASNQNHLQTMHASALFALAETASGEALLAQFPHLSGKVAPVLRDSNIKFKRPATNGVTAYSSITDESAVKFESQFGKKGRSSLKVDVVIKDIDSNVVFTGEFNWFLQGIE